MHMASLVSQNFTDISAACDWLERQGFDCSEYRAQVGLAPAKAA
jgi:hypothetical protein